MSWRQTLSADNITLLIERLILIALAIAAGFGAGVVYMKNDFEHGATYMQRAYTTPGIVTREVIK